MAGLLATAGLLLASPLLFVPRPAGAQALFDAPEETYRGAGERSYEDVYKLLIEKGLSDQAAQRLLREFPPDATFSEEEVNLLLQQITGEELLEKQMKEERSPALEAPREAPALKVGPKEPQLFGMEIFQASPSTFAPPEDLAVGPDYVLGAGDQLQINLWGNVEQRYTPTISRDGSVTLPEIGVVEAAGTPLGEFERRLEALLGKVYSGFRLSVSLGKLRTIRVFVVGEVVRPGAYSISAFSTAFNALYSAGGPGTSGSLRKVLVYRQGRLVATVDLYDYLLRGDRSHDVRLESGDTVFVPPTGPRASIRGEVNRIAIFELLENERVGDLVRMAAGFQATAYTKRVKLDRVVENRGVASLDLDLSAASDSAASPEQDLVLRDGDAVTVYSIWHVHPKNFVEIQGMVQYPGIYQLFPGMRVADLVFLAGGLLDSAFPLRAEISRLPRTVVGHKMTSEILTVSLEPALLDTASDENLALEKNDKVFVRKIPGWKLQENVKVAGEVRFPGIYSIEKREEHLSDLFRRAGGMTEEAFLPGASFFREKEGRVVINFERALEYPLGKEDIVLADGDSINVPRTPSTIQVEGEVGRPGSLLYQPGKKASYYVKRTGGFTEFANRGGTRILRVDGVVDKAFRRFWFDPKVLPGNSILVERESEEKKIDWAGAIKDATTIMASLATTIFVITQINK